MLTRDVSVLAHVFCNLWLVFSRAELFLPLSLKIMKLLGVLKPKILNN
jgi:hypothetical protein